MKNIKENYVPVADFVSTFMIAILFALVLSFPTAERISGSQELVNGSYETTEETTKLINAPSLLYDRLLLEGHRDKLDVAIALVGFFFLLFQPRLISFLIAGCLTYIYFHLSIDWMIDYFWVPDFVKEKMGLLLYGIERSKADGLITIHTPFVYKMHGPFNFSWAAVDAFIPYLLIFCILGSIKLLKGAYLASIKKRLMFVTILIVATTSILANASLYELWTGKFIIKPKNISQALITFISSNTDKDSIILTPKSEFAFSELPISNPWELGWFGLLTGRETYEDRYLVFIDLPNAGNRSSTVFKAYTEESKKIVSLRNSLYKAKWNNIPRGEFLRSGVTHAVLPDGMESGLLRAREDVKLVFRDGGICSKNNTCYHVIEFTK